MNKEDIPPITSSIYIVLSCYNEEETLEEVKNNKRELNPRM